jgi:mRNA interferase MazF
MDCHIGDLAAAGAPSPSKLRFKLFTLDHHLGRLVSIDEQNVRIAMAQLFGLVSVNLVGGAHPAVLQGISL